MTVVVQFYYVFVLHFYSQTRDSRTCRVSRSVGWSVGHISVFRSCSPVRDFGGVYTALFSFQMWYFHCLKHY